MKKILFFALLCVFLISACTQVEAVSTSEVLGKRISLASTPEAQIFLTDDEALQMRNQRVLSESFELEQNPDLWMEAPEGCRKSMVRIFLFNEDSTEIYYGSASLIQAEKMVDLNGDTAWIYRLITANHVVHSVGGQLLGGDIVLFPGDYVDQDFRFRHWDYTQFTDENGEKQDLGMVTVVGIGKLSEIIDDQLAPLEIANVVPFDESSYGWQFFTFDYPGVTEKPQFTESEFAMEIYFPADNPQQIMKPLEDSSVPTNGSSGGAVCSKGGLHMGVVSSHVGNWPADYIIEGNPGNITEQMNKAINKSQTLLKEIGYVFK